MTDSVDIDDIVQFIVDGGLKDAFGSDEVRNYCLRTLADFGCTPPTNRMLLFCIVRAGSPVMGYALKAGGTNLAALLQKHPQVASLFSKIARVCRQEREKEKVKDHLLALMRGESPDPPPLDAASTLEAVQTVYASARLEALDTALHGLTESIREGFANVLKRLEHDPVETLMDCWQDGDAISIADRIRYNSGVYPFVGREEEIALLDRFLGEGIPWTGKLAFGWLLITGDGGMGKTRLAMHYVRNRMPPGWVGRRLPVEQLETMISWAPDWVPRQPTLIVLDYPAQQPERVRVLLQSLLARASQFDFAVRILLLERDASALWFDRTFPQTGDGAALRRHAFTLDGERLDHGYPLKPLGWETTFAILVQWLNQVIDEKLAVPATDETLTALANFLVGFDRQPPMASGDQVLPGAPRPLFVLAALEWARAGLREGRTLEALINEPNSRDALLASLIDRDRTNFWLPLAAGDRDKLGAHENLLALASFALGLPEAMAIAQKAEALHLAHLFPARPDRDLLDSMSDLSAGRLAELQPDLLGEYHALQRLTALRDAHGADTIARFCTLAYTLGEEDAGAFAARCLRDFPALLPPLDWLAPINDAGSDALAPFAGLCMNIAATEPYAVAAPILARLGKANDGQAEETSAVHREAKALFNLASGLGEAQAWNQLPALFARMDRLGERFAASEVIAIEEAQALVNLTISLGKAQFWDLLPELFARMGRLGERLAASEAIAIQEAKALKNLASGVGEAKVWDLRPGLLARIDHLGERFAASEAIAIEEAKALFNLAKGLGDAEAWDQLPDMFARMDRLGERFAASESIAIEEAKALKNLTFGLGKAQVWGLLPDLFARVDRLGERFAASEAIAIEEAMALKNLTFGLGQAREWDRLPELFARMDGLGDRFAASELIAIEEAKALFNLASDLGKAQAWDRLPELFARMDRLGEHFAASEAIAIEEAQALFNLVNGLGEAQAWERLPELFARMDRLGERFAASEAIATEQALALINLASRLGEAQAWARWPVVAARLAALVTRMATVSAGDQRGRLTAAMAAPHVVMGYHMARNSLLPDRSELDIFVGQAVVLIAQAQDSPIEILPSAAVSLIKHFHRHRSEVASVAAAYAALSAAGFDFATVPDIEPDQPPG